MIFEKRPKASFKNATLDLTPDDISKSEIFWIIQSQKSMSEDLRKGRYKRLCPRKRDDGITVSPGYMLSIFINADISEFYLQRVKSDQDFGFKTYQTGQSNET